MSTLRERILAEAARTPAPTRSEWRRRVVIVAVLGALATTALFFVMGGFARGTRPSELVAFTAGLGLFSALVMTRVATGSGGSMLGRPRPHLVLACVALAPVLACVALAAPMLWPEHANEEVALRTHVGCAAITLVQGALPLVVLLLPRRASDPIHPAVTGAALGMTAGAWTAMMAYLRCPHVPAAHCIIAHVVPTLALTALGAVLGRFLLRVR
ncbi:MAG: DUF1109 family protein [Labilithrix sp.]|nr:DUF1109 family protein [Labilithrix sp.]MCW5817007.1 DUF1109 family protein [Labilithrix sp.]